MARQGEEALGQKVQQFDQWVIGEETGEKDCPKDYSRHVCDLQSSYLTLSEAALAPVAACAALYASIQRTLHTLFNILQIEFTKTINCPQIIGIKPKKDEIGRTQWPHLTFLRFPSCSSCAKRSAHVPDVPHKLRKI